MTGGYDRELLRSRLRDIRLGRVFRVIHRDRRSTPLGAAVHAGRPEADGFLFPSRFTGDTCVAVFDRSFGKLAALDIADIAGHVDFLDALDDYDIVLTGPPG